jgi:hypothetical protein
MLLAIRRVAFTTVAMTVLALAAGCAAAGESEQGEPALPEPLPRVDMATFQLPLDAYTAAPTQARTLNEARNLFIVACLDRFGFHVEAPKQSEVSKIGPNQLRYLIADENRAKAFGYKVPEISNAPRPPEPSMPAAATAVINGRGASVVGGQEVPDGGCIGEAYRKLGVDKRTQERRDVVETIRNDAYVRMKNDSRVVAAVSRWSACMLRSGYHYPDPAHANDDPVFATEVASETEIATAVADVRCKRESNVIELMAATESAYQQRAIAAHQTELQAVREALDNELRLAADVVAGRRT